MNDPHVVALMYRVDHSESVSYAKAAPCEYDGPQFLVRIKENSATIEMKDHFATPEEARVVIEPFLRAWELDAGLKRDGLNVLRFDYERAKLVDRNPPATPPGTIALAAGVAAGRATARGTITVLPFEPERYPEPPAGLFVSTDVDAMYDRFTRYKSGRTILGDMANFCLTVLEGSAKGQQRSAAAKKYRIQREVLTRLSDLAADKGGPRHARKAKGLRADYTNQERAWIEATVKAMIRRAAEIAHDPSAARRRITMGDLPPL